MQHLDAKQTRAIALLSLAAFASAASLRVSDPLLRQLASDFGTTTGKAGQAIYAFSVAYGLFQALYGPLGDRYGKYRLVALATLGCIIGSAGASLAISFGWLLFFRALAGATAAGIIPLSMAWIGDSVSYEHRQSTLARFLSGQILGVIGGQLIGGLFADTLGWRWGFVFLTAVYFVVGVLLLAEHRKNASTQAGPASSVHQTVPFLAQMLSVLRIGWARRVLVTVSLEGMALFGALAFVPSYLHSRFGVSLIAAGTILGGFGVGGLSYTFVAKRLVSRLGERGLALGGGLLLGFAFLLLFLATKWFLTVPACFVAGLGFYMLHNTLQTNATQMAPNARGTAVSLFASAFFLGQSVGVAAAAVVVDSASASLLFAGASLLLPLVGLSFTSALRQRPLDLVSA